MTRKLRKKALKISEVIKKTLRTKKTKKHAFLTKIKCVKDVFFNINGGLYKSAQNVYLLLNDGADESVTEVRQGSNVEHWYYVDNRTN